MDALTRGTQAGIDIFLNVAAMLIVVIALVFLVNATLGVLPDFQGEVFEGSKYLLAWADNLKEIKTVCWCSRKATMVVRLDKEGNIVSQGEQLEIGGNEKYVPLCRAHFNKKKLSN